MRLTALQLPAKFGDVAGQLALASDLLERGPATDLVLLPEAALTGYVSPEHDFDLAPFAEPLNGPTATALSSLARRFDCLVVGPVIEREGAAVFNSLVGMGPDGERLIHYRKHHPWFPETWATPGAGPGEVLVWRGCRMLPAICFDVHFLAGDAGERLEAADVVLFASAWVDEATDARPALLSGIAQRHRVAVLNANWGSGQPRILGQGGSMFIDPSGAVQDRLGPGLARLDASCAGAFSG